MAENEGTITIKKDAIWKYSTFVLLAVLVIGGILFILPNNPSPTGNVINNPGAPAPTVTVKVLESDNFAYGNADSEVKIVEYSDFECPFCERAYSGAIAEIKASYSEDEVAIIYRDFPLSFHPQAQKAAEASECAADQGKFKEMHDMLFEQGVVGGVDTFKSYAAQLGLDTAKFNACLDSGEKAAEIRQDMADGQKSGIQGTPGFLIAGSDGKGTLVSGAQPFTVFQQIIDSKL